MARISRIGVIADTHGRVHPAVVDVFKDVDHIVHAGDIGGMHVLDALRALAPVTSVDGNNDKASGEEIERVKLGTLRVLLTHILPRPHKLAARVTESLRDRPADVVIFGHSHLPHNEIGDGVRYFNPASAGARRFSFPVSVGLFEKQGRDWNAVHVALDERSVAALKRWMNQLSKRQSG
ncbi:MAG TPA: metallophosphoesterase family protein [Thermoanaerobaculia bacterium]|nr:metallophosphoesterase family protein [Thermoanaerobaculia bacterium]